MVTDSDFTAKYDLVRARKNPNIDEKTWKETKKTKFPPKLDVGTQ